MTLLRMLVFMPGGAQSEPGRAIPQPQQPARSTPPVAAAASPSPVAQTKVQAAPAVEIVAAKPVATSSGQLDWGVLLAQLNVQGMAKELAKHCTLESFVDGRLTLNLAPQQKHLQTNKMALDKLQAALADYFAQPVRLAVTLGAANAATPAAVEQHEKQTRQQVAVEAIAQDPFVREAQAQLGAQVIEDSIKPI